jgi:hypothetical protein
MTLARVVCYSFTVEDFHVLFAQSSGALNVHKFPFLEFFPRGTTTEPLSLRKTLRGKRYHTVEGAILLQNSPGTLSDLTSLNFKAERTQKK